MSDMSKSESAWNFNGSYLVPVHLATSPLAHELHNSPESLLGVGHPLLQQTGAGLASLQPGLGHGKTDLCARQVSPAPGEASLEVANSGGQGRHRRIAARGRGRGRGRRSVSRRTDWAIGKAGQTLQCAHARNEGVDLGPGVDAEGRDAPGDLVEVEVGGREDLKSGQQRHFHDIAE